MIYHVYAAPSPQRAPSVGPSMDPLPWHAVIMQHEQRAVRNNTRAGRGKHVAIPRRTTPTCGLRLRVSHVLKKPTSHNEALEPIQRSQRRARAESDG